MRSRDSRRHRPIAYRTRAALLGSPQGSGDLGASPDPPGDVCGNRTLSETQRGAPETRSSSAIRTRRRSAVRTDHHRVFLGE